MRKFSRFIICVIAYLYIPVLITLLFYSDLDTYSVATTSERTVTIVYSSVKQKLLIDDYVTYALCKEYNEGYSKECLKALSVLIRSDVMKCMGARQNIDSTKLSREYYTKSDMRLNWGGDWKDKYEYIRGCVGETTGEVLKSEGQIIKPVYTEVSVGKTFEGDKIYGEGYEYLTAIECEEDKSSPSYSVQIPLTPDMILDALEKLDYSTGIDASAPHKDIQVIAKTDSGYVTGVQVGDRIMSGVEFARVFGLNSPYITMEYRSDKIEVTTVGKGVSLGMSIYTANIMSGQGKDYKGLLMHFYPKCQIDRVL